MPSTLLLTIEQMAIKNSKILTVAGLSFVGFCAVSLGVDRANVGPLASQVAGFCGAFVGGWVGSRRRRSRAKSTLAPTPSGLADQPVPPLPETSETQEASR